MRYWDDTEEDNWQWEGNRGVNEIKWQLNEGIVNEQSVTKMGMKRKMNENVNNWKGEDQNETRMETKMRIKWRNKGDENEISRKLTRLEWRGCDEMRKMKRARLL